MSWRRRPPTLLLVLLLAGCEAGKAPPGILPELDAIHDLSLPADARHHRAHPVVRGDYSMVLDWSFETAMTWLEYLDWLQQRLPSGFERRSEGSRAARFVRALPADLQVLEVTRVERGGLQVLELRLESQAF